MCACLEGSVWSLLYVLFAYEIRYSKLARRLRFKLIPGPCPSLTSSSLATWHNLCIDIASRDIFNSILFSVYEIA